jgi:hypothetical protein
LLDPAVTGLLARGEYKMSTFKPYRMAIVAFAALVCTGAQSPCGGDPLPSRAAALLEARNGTGAASAIAFTGATPFVEGDPTLASAEWRSGLGCPTNLSAPFACFASSDPADVVNTGLVLVKTGPTTLDPAIDLSGYPNSVNVDLPPFAGVELQGVAGGSVADLTELGFDLRKAGSNSFFNLAGSHCGLRAPRFNVVTQGAAGTTTHRFYCADGIMPIDGFNQGWVRLRWLPEQADPPMDLADSITSMKIILDEGQDLIPEDFFGVAVLDNIDVNGILVGSAQPAPEFDDEEEGQGEDEHHNGFHFHGSWTHIEKGRLSYYDRAAKLKFVSKGARSLRSTGPKCVALVADGKVNGRAGYTATLETCDHSGEKRVGQFSITITGPGNFLYEKTATVTKGKVKVRD